MTRQYDLIPPVMFQYRVYLTARLFFIPYRSRDSEAYRHDLHRDYSDLAIFGAKWILFADFGQKLGIRVQTNAYTVYEENWKSCLRCVWTVPVTQVWSWRGFSREEICDSEGEDRERGPKRCAAEVKLVVP